MFPYAFTVLVGCASRNGQGSKPRSGVILKRKKHYRGSGVIQDGIDSVRTVSEILNTLYVLIKS